ncbi:Hypothetical predicted protein [Paramuricea clavata]|uniref:Uncharacterized protein n=1 Tax=Paramuricea clavata TaxID=317549 RepID=A0A6S7GT86_PARCT|nr:Hypothetical predicted protein [Paramuricea clavata]
MAFSAPFSAPQMDWETNDSILVFGKFKQKCELMMFKSILKGLDIYHSWTFEDGKDQNNLEKQNENDPYADITTIGTIKINSVENHSNTTSEEIFTTLRVNRKNNGDIDLNANSLCTGNKICARKNVFRDVAQGPIEEEVKPSKSVRFADQAKIINQQRIGIGPEVKLNLLCQSEAVLIDETYRNCLGATGVADDITVHCQYESNHDLHLHDAMERSRMVGIKLNQEKCIPDPEKVMAIQSMKPPKDKKELHTFLGMVNYLAPFMPNLPSHTAPLRELLWDNVDYQWFFSYTRAFDILKCQISTETTLS